MSATSSSPPMAISEGPNLSVRIAAVLVVIALAALAGYTVFSGPTRVSSLVDHRIPAPSRLPPHHKQQEDTEGEGGGGG